MQNTYLIEPDIAFIKKLVGLGGDTLKKCFQCATCSVICPISPDKKPFPRKEMIAASWGLKERLIGNLDIWLCHNCGDCTTNCPRGAKPSDVLGAIRSMAIAEYAVPKSLGNAINDPKKLPLLLAIPIILFLVVGFSTGLLDLTPGGGEIVHAKFFSTWLVDIIMIPAMFWSIVIFALGLKRFLNDIHQNALIEGKTEKKEIDPAGFIKAFFRVIPTIFKHTKFADCSENKDRRVNHMMVLFGFIGLFMVTSIFFVAVYVFQNHGPYSQMNPVKWLANISGIALIIGSCLMIKNRLAKPDQFSNYKDWYLLGLALALGLSGMLTEITRLAGWGGVSYFIYFVHLMFVFCLFAYTPFSKLAHLAYRTTALAYNEYTGRI